jgi:hypothetical protein
MAKESNRYLRLVAVFMTMLLISGVYASLTPNVCAAEATIKEKGLSILSNVVGLDTSKYNISLTLYPNDLYRDVLPRENVRSTLNANGSKIDALCTFINGSLQMINVFANEGSPRMTTSTGSVASMAQRFLSNYQTQSQDSFYGELNSMLTKVDADKNFTSTVGNTKLTVTTSKNDSLFKWTYTFNGIDAPDKCVALRYKNGFLKYFVDNWNLYKIGSINVNLSEQEAIDIAVTRARNYSPDSKSENGTIGGLKFNVTNAMITETIFAPSLYVDAEKARSRDLFELYPMRNVWISLDKFYPGNVYGFNVYVWADTKEICYIHERVSTIDPPPELVASATDFTMESLDNQASNVTKVKRNSSSISILVLMFVVSATVMTLVYFGKKKNPPDLNLPKLRCLKVKGVLLCLLIASPLLAFTMSASFAKATPYNGAATVWGSESIGSINEDLEPDESWRKTYDEVVWQQNTSAYIAGLFASNGYSSSNNQDAHNLGSNKSAILGHIQSLETTYPRVAIVDFDHGNGKNNTNISGAPADEFHYMFEDNWGTREGPTYNTDDSHANEHAVFDDDIYERTSGKTFFAFINTCNSAHVNATFYFEDTNSTQGLIDGDRARGMPFAWSHGLKVTDEPDSTPPSGWISSNGYTDADSGDFCYIGFDSGSAALDQTVENSDYHYYYWVYHFFYFALTADYTINEALDLASHEAFYGSPDFDESPLFNSNGFTAIWRMYIEGEWQEFWGNFHFLVPNCHMKVYGNGNLKLFQPLLTVNAYDDYNNQVWPTFDIDGNSHGTGTLRLVSGSHTFDVSNLSGYSFDHFHFDYGGSSANVYYHPRTQSIPSDCVLTAYYTVGFSDNFNDNSIDTLNWEKLMNGATVDETNNQLEVNVTQGTGQVQAGYVTKNAYNMQDMATIIDVTQFSYLDEMILQIGTTKTTNSDPYDQSNWYRILKARYDSNVYVQSSVDGDLSTMVMTNWMSATGSLAISVNDGYIALYENGNLRYSEPYALPSYNCYVYVFTSTLGTRAWGTDKFDNFELSPKRYEFYNTGDDDYGWNRGGANVWQAQTFTVGAIGHTVDSIKLKLFRAGNPGTFTVSIRATDGNGLPNGSDLTSGSVAGTSLPTTAAWFEIAVTQHTLSANTKYAIVCRSSTGDLSNYFAWRCDTSSPSYTSGNRAYSTNSGSTWSNDMNQDFMFEVRG